jgi:excisionase family DNA binding protein
VENGGIEGTNAEGPKMKPNTPSPADDWLTVKQAREIVQCGEKLLYREIRAGRLRAARLGGRRDLRVHRTWIHEWLLACSRPVEISR